MPAVKYAKTEIVNDDKVGVGQFVKVLDFSTLNFGEPDILKHTAEVEVGDLESERAGLMPNGRSESALACLGWASDENGQSEANLRLVQVAVET